MLKILKFPLNTNKIQTAIKGQNCNILNIKRCLMNLNGKSKNSIFEIINNKKIKIKDYEINFLDDYEDYVSDLIFSNESFSKIKISL